MWIFRATLAHNSNVMFREREEREVQRLLCSTFKAREPLQHKHVGTHTQPHADARTHAHTHASSQTCLRTPLLLPPSPLITLPTPHPQHRHVRTDPPPPQQTHTCLLYLRRSEIENINRNRRRTVATSSAPLTTLSFHH